MADSDELVNLQKSNTCWYEEPDLSFEVSDLFESMQEDVDEMKALQDELRLHQDKFQGLEDLRERLFGEGEPLAEAI